MFWVCARTDLASSAPSISPGIRMSVRIKSTSLEFKESDGFVATVGLDHIKARTAKLISQVEPEEHLVFNYENGVVCTFGLRL